MYVCRPDGTTVTSRERVGLRKRVVIFFSLYLHNRLGRGGQRSEGKDASESKNGREIERRSRSQT